MKRGSPSSGYTVVEVLIVLAVSAALFASAVATMGGQTRRTDFATAMRDAELIMQDIINDVATGYYAKVANFSCKAPSSGGPPDIKYTGNNEQGTNIGCIFIGRAIQIGVSGNLNQYNVYDIVGLQHADGTSRNVRNLAEAQPVVLTTTPVIAQLPGGLEVQTVKYFNDTGGHDMGAMAFVTSLDNSGGGNTSESGSNTVDVYPMEGSSLLSQTAVDAEAQISALPSAVRNPFGGIVICLLGGVNDSYGEITIGAEYGRMSTKTEIKTGVCPP